MPHITRFRRVIRGAYCSSNFASYSSTWPGNARLKEGSGSKWGLIPNCSCDVPRIRTSVVSRLRSRVRRFSLKKLGAPARFHSAQAQKKRSGAKKRKRRAAGESILKLKINELPVVEKPQKDDGQDQRVVGRPADPKGSLGK